MTKSYHSDPFDAAAHAWIERDSGALLSEKGIDPVVVCAMLRAGWIEEVSTPEEARVFGARFAVNPAVSPTDSLPFPSLASLMDPMGPAHWIMVLWCDWSFQLRDRPLTNGVEGPPAPWALTPGTVHG